MTSTISKSHHLGTLPHKGIYRLPYYILKLTGKDILSFLNGLTSNDLQIHSLPAIIPTLFLDTNGKIVQFALIARFADAIYIGIEESSAEIIMQYFDYFHIREDVKISKSEDPHAFYVLYGDGTTALTGSPDVPAGHDRFCSYAFCDPNKELPANIQTLNLTELKGALFSELRYALDFPIILTDFKKRVYPHEAGLKRYVSFTKGCFVGQEPVSRMEHKFTAAKRRILVSSPTELLAGTKTYVSDKLAGTIVSASSVSFKNAFFGYAKIKTSLLETIHTSSLKDEAGITITVHD